MDLDGPPGGKGLGRPSGLPHFSTSSSALGLTSTVGEVSSCGVLGFVVSSVPWAKVQGSKTISALEHWDFSSSEGVTAPSAKGFNLCI